MMQRQKRIYIAVHLKFQNYSEYSSILLQNLAEASAEMIKKIRWLCSHYDIGPHDVYNFDELRLFAAKQDKNSTTLAFKSDKDPMIRKIQNPKEAYTGIIMANGDGSELMVFLVTKKALPIGSTIHSVQVDDRQWDKDRKCVVVKKVDIRFTVLHGITVLKVPPGVKAWCSGNITKAFLLLTLFRTDRPSILQVKI